MKKKFYELIQTHNNILVLTRPEIGRAAQFKHDAQKIENKMKSLVIELQQEAINPNSAISDLLRKAYVVSSKLNINDFKLWIESEMKGYKDNSIIPSYRKIKGTVKAYNPYNGWIPVVMEDSELLSHISKRSIGQPIAEIESLYLKKDNSGFLQVPLPHEWVKKIFKNSAEFRLGMVPTLLVDSSQLVGILEAVRNEILEWSLKLESEGILGTDMSFSKEEINKAESVTYNINAFHGVLGNVNSSTIQIGDYASIHEALKEKGVPQEERNEIENILEDLKTTTSDHKPELINKGLNWVKRNAQTIGTLSATIKNWFDMLL